IICGGRLSTTYQSMSSSTLATVVRPAPDMPVTSTTSMGWSEPSAGPVSSLVLLCPCPSGAGHCIFQHYSKPDSNLSVGHRLNDLRGQGGTDPLDLADLLGRGGPDLLHGAEVPEQSGAFGLSQTGDVIEDRARHRLRPFGPVVGDGEAVGLIAQPLHEEQALRSEERRGGHEGRW